MRGTVGTCTAAVYNQNYFVSSGSFITVSNISGSCRKSIAQNPFVLHGAHCIGTGIGKNKFVIDA